METLDINTFFTELKTTVEITKQFQKTNSLEYAFEFNPLIHFYDIGENKLSNMLAFFLNPNQKHGQGGIFLKSFLELFIGDEFNLKETIGDFKSVEISREKQTIGQRRLDILLNFDGQFAIGIENKIWARDQYHQLNDYKNWLNETYSGNFILIYLTPYGKPPSDDSISKEEYSKLAEEKKIFLLNHSKDILELINLWTKISQADKVRNFLKDFQQLIQHKVNGNIFMNQQKTIADFILENPKYIEISFGVYESMERVKKSLFEILIKQTEEIAKELHLTTRPDDKIWEKGGGINFLHPDLTKDHLRIKFLFGDNLIWKDYGVVCKEVKSYPGNPEVKFIEEHQEEYKKILNFKNSNDFWYAYDNHTEVNEPIIKVKNGDMKNIIKEKIVKLLDAFKQLDSERYQFKPIEQPNNSTLLV